MTCDAADVACLCLVLDSWCVDAVTLWDLCNALWGIVLPDDNTSEMSYRCQMARREAVSQWLTSSSLSLINAEVQSADVKVIYCLPIKL